ncbi:MAG: AMP-binding protein [Desulfosarcinaceae bacterium]
MNIARSIERSAFHFPDRPAVSINGKETTYKQLNENANRAATALIDLGVRPGDHVAICIPNSLEWITFYFGVIKTGAIAVTFSNQLTATEFAQSAADSRPKCILTTKERIDECLPLQSQGVVEKIIAPGGDLSYEQLCAQGTDVYEAVEQNRTDTAAILFTGGTTGIPKGVMLSHENITTAIYNVVFNERSTEKDRALCFLPFNHVFAQMHIMNATMLSGGCLELIPTFNLDTVLELTAAGKVTKLFGVPTIYVRLLSVDNIQEKLGAVRYCFSAAASMAVELVRQWKQRTGLDIHEAYGMTESASMVTYNHYYKHVIGSVGTPAGATEVGIFDDNGRPVARGDEGEICIRGRNIMTGYLNRPDETRASFWGDWFRSGDIGRLDENGYLFIVDRLKDMIITGGENVYPREIEEALFTLPQVKECAVLGLPDSEWGERVTAMIVPAPGRPPEPRELKDALKRLLSAYKIPKEFHIVEELPKSNAGKILKRLIKQNIQADDPGDGGVAGP